MMTEALLVWFKYIMLNGPLCRALGCHAGVDPVARVTHNSHKSMKMFSFILER